MIKILSLEIFGFKHQSRKCNINFSLENISVIYGINGSGKTTLLNILGAILSQDESILLKENVEKIILYYSIDDIVKEPIIIDKNDESDSTLVSTKEGQIDLSTKLYNWKTFEKSELVNTKSISIGVQRGIPVQNMNITSDTIYGFFRNPRQRFRMEMDLQKLKMISDDLVNYLEDIYKFERKRLLFKRKTPLDSDHAFTDTLKFDDIEFFLVNRYTEAKSIISNKIQNALFDTLALVIGPEKIEKEIFPEDFYNIVKTKKDRLIEALVETSDNENHFREKIIGILKNIENKEYWESIKSNETIKNLLYRMMKELEEEEQFLGSINILVEKFNQYIQKNKKLIIDKETAYISINNGARIHKLNDLSSGERHLLTFLTMVLIDINKRNFLFIDEPEISLHIKWQQKLLPLISELAPTTQIIVASHSPSIANKSTKYLSEIFVSE